VKETLGQGYHGRAGIKQCVMFSCVGPYTSPSNMHASLVGLCGCVPSSQVPADGLWLDMNEVRREGWVLLPD
jgi:hypothetical protein